jgi:ubiquinone/menaquinone biosynthesis C-methylase UbiE
MDQLSFPDGFFDVALCLGAFEYVLDEKASIKEIARTVKEQGALIITMHNKYSPYRIWSNYAYGKVKNAMARLKGLFTSVKDETCNNARPHFIVRSEKELRRLVGAEAFTVEDIVYYDFNIFLGPLDELFPKTAVFMSRKLECLGRTWLKFLGTGFIMKCRKTGHSR